MKKLFFYLVFNFITTHQVFAKEKTKVTDVEQETLDTDSTETKSRENVRSTFFMIQPVDLVAQIHPSFELIHIISAGPKLSHAVSFAYWGSDKKYKEKIPSYLEESVEHNIHLRMDAVAARYKIYFGRFFYLNSGMGVRKFTSTESLNYVGLNDVSAEKYSTSLGLDLGLGNRWVFKNGLVIGGNWLQVFFPFKVLSEKDADAPEGYTVKEGPGITSREADGELFSFRLSILDIGYAW